MYNNIATQQPPTSGKVILNTTQGELDIELWCKETPKACKNFIQLCLEGYYDSTIFFRLIPGFMIQGGDPSGTGQGFITKKFKPILEGESIYGKPFQDEFHQRLTFNSRGILAMANSKLNDNGSQFFITFDSCSWLDKKHTIFGKVVGNTIYNLMQMTQVDTDADDRPINEIKLISAKVIINPFEDLIVRNSNPSNAKQDQQQVEKAQQAKKQVTKQNQAKKLKNTSLLSFQEEENEEPAIVKKVLNSHDALEDPRLKKEVAVTQEEIEQQRLLEQQKLENLKQQIQTPQAKDETIKMQKRQLPKFDASQNLHQNEEERQLLKVKTRKGPNGEIEYYWEESESSSSSESSEIEDEDMKQQRLKQKEEYDLLKAEILQFKKNKIGTYNEQLQESIKHEKKLLSNVESKRMKYLQDKKYQKHEDHIMERLNAFREKAASQSVKDDRYHWLNHRLKFHVDSANAYNVVDTKEKVQDFYALAKSKKQNKKYIKFIVSDNAKKQTKNINKLINLTEE